MNRLPVPSIVTVFDYLKGLDSLLRLLGIAALGEPEPFVLQITIHKPCRPVSNPTDQGCQGCYGTDWVLVFS